MFFQLVSLTARMQAESNYARFGICMQIIMRHYTYNANSHQCSLSYSDERLVKFSLLVLSHL